MSDKKVTALLTQGGAGDIVAATPMIRAYRKAFPDDEIIVLTTYKQVLENNPNIDTLFAINEMRDFYSEYVLKRDLRVFKKRFVYDYFHDVPGFASENLMDFICQCYNIEWDGEGPEYYTTPYESRAAKTFMKQSGKPKILLHIYGAVPSDGGYQTMLCGICGGKGIDPSGQRCGNCGGSGKLVIRNKTNNMKDLNPEIVAPLVDKYKDTFDFLQIGLEGEPIVPGAFDCLGMPLRDTAALIPECASFIFIESLFAHIAGAFKKPGVVVFQNTSPEFFGYKTNFNVWDSGGCDLWPCNRPVGALQDLMPGYKNPKTKEPALWECPDQLCSRMKPEKLMKVFEEAVADVIKEEKPAQLSVKDGMLHLDRPEGDDGHNTLEEARRGSV